MDKNNLCSNCVYNNDKEKLFCKANHNKSIIGKKKFCLDYSPKK